MGGASRAGQGSHVNKHVALLTVLVLWAGPAFATEFMLYDGESLAGWQVVGEANWVSREGVIEAAGAGDGFLLSDNKYANFVLTLEFWVDATTNSGVFIGCPGGGKIHPEQCYEINIWDDHPKPPARTGAIVFEVMPPLVHLETVGKWNTYEISHTGTRVTATLNGELTAVLDDARPEAGHIALQHFGDGVVRFRKLRLRRVD